MKLHLIRHANAKSPKELLDFDRPLSKKGKEQSRELAHHLLNKKLPNIVWCSAAQRTMETLLFIEEKHHFSDKKYLDALYLCEKTFLLKELWKENHEEDLLIVGHNFGLSDLVNYFTGELFLMDTGEYICIDFGKLSLNESSKETGIIVDRFIP